MDGPRFDTLTRTLATPTSRRTAIGLILGAVAVAAGLGRGSATAQDGAETAARRNPFWRAGRRCDSGQPCGELAPCFSLSGRCEPDKCLIDGGRRDFGENPANPCQFCRPTLDDPASWYAWQYLPDGELCEDSGGVCSHANDHCIGGECVPNPLPDGSPCGGDGGACCDGDCCHPGTVCSESGCVPGCTTADGPYVDGAVNPGHDCEACRVDLSTTAWSLADNGAACGETQNRICCNGICCGAGETCDPDALICGETCDVLDRNRGDGTCDADGCTIDGVFYEDGARNPGNECQACDPSTSTTSWSPGTFGACGSNGDRWCAGGVCCDLGICPDLAVDVCGDYCDARCAIGGVLYETLDRNPANPCEFCAPSVSHTAWTIVPPSYACDPVTLAGQCCDGTCCNDGTFCSHEWVCVAPGS